MGMLGIEIGSERLGSEGSEGGVGCLPAPPFGNSMVGKVGSEGREGKDGIGILGMEIGSEGSSILMTMSKIVAPLNVPIASITSAGILDTHLHR